MLGVSATEPTADPAGPAPAPADRLPAPLRIAAALSWRGLLLVGAAALVAVVASRLAVVTVPAAIAVFLSALLSPAVRGLVHRGLPRPVATATVLVVGLGALAGIGIVVVRAIGDALPALLATLTDALRGVQEWLLTGPLRSAAGALVPSTQEGLALLGGDPAAFTAGLATTAVGVALTLGEIATGVLLVLFVLIFLLLDGAQVWTFLIGGVPRDGRRLAHRSGLRAFAALGEHLYGAAITAVIAAVGTGVALGLLGVPLAVPLAAVVLLGGFVPVVGPLATGAGTVLVTLVAVGGWRATGVLVALVLLSVLARRIVVPRVLGRSAPLHPLATVLAVAVGVVLGGVVGVLLAVPLLAAARGAADPLLDETRRRGARHRGEQPVPAPAD